MATNNPAQELQALKARVMALEGERQSLRSILDHNPAVTYRAKASGDFAATYISAGITAQLGYQPRDFIEDPTFWADHLHPEDESRVLAEMAQAVDNGSRVFEYRFRHQDETYRWMRDECHVDAENEPPALIGYWTDVTERKEAERRLQQSEAMFRTLAERSHAMISLIDGHRFVYANPRLAELSGYTQNELMGMESKQLAPPDVREDLADRSQARLRGDDVPSHYEAPLLTRHGETR